MKNSSKLTRTIMTDSNSSHESNSDDENNRLPTVDSIFSNHNKKQIVVKQPITKNSSNRISFNESTCTNNGIKHGARSNGYNDLFYQQHKDILMSFDNNNSYLPKDMNEDRCLEKTGWLNVKHWLTIPCHEKVQLTSTNQYKRFWICLKDSNLQLFNDCLDTNPTFTINTIDCLCYPLSEYRQYVFSLTTNTGDTYCFQSSNQSELDDWIRCIHSSCLLNLHPNLLKSNLKQLENDILYENKMLKLAGLQLKLTTNEKTRLFISKQIESLEKNLEIFYINLFRKKCYLSAFDENENLPNSKDLLSHISPTTKMSLLKLQALTPGGFYACIISRRRLNYQREEMISAEPISSIETVLFGFNPQKRVVVPINKTTTVGELLKHVTNKLSLEVNNYFLYFNSTSFNGFISNLNDKLNTLTYSSIEIRPKLIYQIKLNNQFNLSGIEINQQYPSTFFVSYVNKGSEGERFGVLKGDEIIMLNNFSTRNLDSTRFNRYLNQIPMILTLRSSRLNRTINNSTNENNHVSSLLINEQQLPTKSLSNTQQIQKVVFELIQTERSYVQDMQYLLKQYIEPLRNNSTVLPSDVIELLYNSVKSIYQLQITFLDKLQFDLLTENIPVSIAETFISFSKDFKLYSTYCAMHLRINRLLNLYQNNEDLKEFLILCNPYHQHSLSFESYLIKPVQRILKYPLFLQQIFIYCQIDEQKQILSLKQSIKMMKKLSQYINSMQKLYEDFGQSFENFIKNYKEQYNKIFELNLPELYAYGEINWMNIYRFLSRRNSRDLKTFVFVFRKGCLLLVREQLNNKNLSDCFIRFLPMKELQVELINNDDNEHQNYTWQLIQINSITQVKTYFRFVNKDAHTFVKTIKNCISELSNSLEISFEQKRSSSSRLYHDLVSIDLLSNQHSKKNGFVNNRRSPSPVWKRRTTSLRKRPVSMTNNMNFN